MRAKIHPPGFSRSGSVDLEAAASGHGHSGFAMTCQFKYLRRVSVLVLPELLSFSDGTYQMPLSLPVIFCPTTAAVASHGNRLSRAPLCNSRLRIRPASCFP